MIAALVFDFPPGWQFGLPLSLAALTVMAVLQRRRGLGGKQIAALTALRAVALGILVFLAARPVWIDRSPAEPGRRFAAVLVDRSESMSLEEQGDTRYAHALDFLRERLLPTLNESKLPAQAMLFAQDTEPADGDKLNAATPDGRRTNLGRAIARAVNDAARPPLAVIALTDGAANEHADNARALSALAEAGVPFIGVGFGSDLGVQTLSLRNVDAPPIVAPDTEFVIGARLEMINGDDLPAFDLVLLRDGAMVQTKSVKGGSGSRFWQESFRVTEKEQGAHRYTVQMLPPVKSGLKCIETEGSTTVRITHEKELRVLYVQGAMTWDYKFVGLALRGDPTIKLTGLTRTSKQSVFRQNVETAGELMQGFPSTLEEIAPFRIIVLSNLKPLDLTPPQQELLARFCGELGGGVLMIGGPDTFNASWQGSRLEQLMPVVFSGSQGVVGLDRQFRIAMTEEAFQHPVFQITDSRGAREAWGELPTFTHYGRVDSAKPGAQVWAHHPDDEGPRGRRILMAAQRYGAGLSAVICVQNFWRWRLAKETDPQLFDRFWRQLFRYLSESSRQDVMIHLADQELHPQMDVRITLEKQPSPNTAAEPAQSFTVRVEDDQKVTVREETLELTPSRPVDMTFPAATAGIYTVTVQDRNTQPVASRSIEIRDVNVEFQNTGRNMESLRQWAALTGGLAVKVEDCRDADELVAQIKEKIEQARQAQTVRRPVGVNAWLLGALLGSLGAEWLLRKRWSMA